MTTSDARKRNAERTYVTDFTLTENGLLINNHTGEVTPLTRNQEDDPMTAKDRHDELVALLNKISEESVTTSNVLADMLDLLRERLPERTEVKVAPFDPDLAAAGLLATPEHDAAVAAEWADYFEVRQGTVGPERLTVESMIAALRGPRPFGCEAGESGADA